MLDSFHRHKSKNQSNRHCYRNRLLHACTDLMQYSNHYHDRYILLWKRRFSFFCYVLWKDENKILQIYFASLNDFFWFPPLAKKSRQKYLYKGKKFRISLYTVYNDKICEQPQMEMRMKLTTFSFVAILCFTPSGCTD